MNPRCALVLFALPLLVTSCQSQALVVPPRSIGEEFLTELWVYNPPQDLSGIDNDGTDVVGRDAFKAWAKSFSSKNGDMRLTSLDMFSSADGKRVVSRWKVTGRNLGVLGTHADNRPIEFTASRA
ncbi:nuclear transport factor 2 family protein [Polyangium mundeleinium]|uniref:Nuclear transport factor 2 family protein n=1 Tax=Polyangium mundeleinium TaxID=2995306 RepID=A0ABT5F5H9_9BACT|nr:nuclear transport factor 2 family protein [Polyangium mundeleinium]MDC0748653.1 nuclear transport factor 2 family protein [Polyangium mundeleinium]